MQRPNSAQKSPEVSGHRLSKKPEEVSEGLQAASSFSKKVAAATFLTR